MRASHWDAPARARPGACVPRAWRRGRRPTKQQTAKRQPTAPKQATRTISTWSRTTTSRHRAPRTDDGHEPEHGHRPTSSHVPSHTSPEARRKSKELTETRGTSRVRALVFRPPRQGEHPAQPLNEGEALWHTRESRRPGDTRDSSHGANGHGACRKGDCYSDTRYERQAGKAASGGPDSEGTGKTASSGVREVGGVGRSGPLARPVIPYGVPDAGRQCKHLPGQTREPNLSPRNERSSEHRMCHHCEHVARYRALSCQLGL